MRIASLRPVGLAAESELPPHKLTVDSQLSRFCDEERVSTPPDIAQVVMVRSMGRDELARRWRLADGQYVEAMKLLPWPAVACITQQAVIVGHYGDNVTASGWRVGWGVRLTRLSDLKTFKKYFFADPDSRIGVSGGRTRGDPSPQFVKWVKKLAQKR